MTNELSAELHWLTLTTIMTALLWIPYILNRMREQGIFEALWDPQGNTSTQYLWARRMMHAHQNAVENLAIFSTLTILIQITGTNSEITAIACMTYFYARMMHFIAFTFAIPLLRVITFLTGFGAQMVMGFTLLAQL